VCCNSACSGACDVCAASLGASADGTCSILPAGATGSPACGNGVACDGTDAACPAAPCASDVDCLPGDYCGASGSCTARKAQGAACDAAAGADCNVAGCRVCTTGSCFDDVCCASASCGPCQACAAVKKQTGVGDGTCGPAKAGTNPHNDVCATSPPATCGADGQCDGNGGCQTYYPAGVSCGASTCSPAGDVAQGLLCNGAGTCAQNSMILCDPYLCVAGGCPTGCTTDAQCIATAYCTAAHSCAFRQDPGKSCTAADQCASGNCVDGFCCDQACTGQCEACDVPDQLGTCWPVGGTPHGARPVCAGSDGGPVGACSGACDGTNTAACTYPMATTSCGSTCSGSTLTTSVCNGSGTCAAGTPAACPGNLTCASDGAACKASCATDTDCANGFGCSGGTCTPEVGAVCSGPHTSMNVNGDAGNGGTRECEPYLCDRGTGACKTRCASVADCVAPEVCNASAQCVTAPNAMAATANGSSGCQVAPAPASGGGWAWVSALAVMSIARRRPRRRSHARIVTHR
jgi:hypothetical protein